MAFDATVPSREEQTLKLQNKFQFQGGKALPAAGMVAPLEKNQPYKPGMRSSHVKKSEEEKIFEKIVQEIEERQKFLKDMAALGDHSNDARLTKEIEERIEDMKVLHNLIEAQKK